MQILVDKMPEDPEDCPYASYVSNRCGDGWVSCQKASIVCEDTSKCPFFRAITDFMNDYLVWKGIKNG